MIQVKGWDKFNTWVKSIHDSPDLTKKEKEYIDNRINEEISNGNHAHDPEWWNEGAIGLGYFFIWSPEDDTNGIRKADSLGF